MKKLILLFLMLELLISCSGSSEKNKIENIKKYASITIDKDTLVSISNGPFEYGSACGYVNFKGDTIIPIGTFNMCFTDTFRTYAYVVDKDIYGEKMVAINRNREVIFEAYLFDNGPDFLSEGLFRITRNGKIGFANEQGEVVIEPIYECAYSFENGKAKVAKDCETITENLDHSSWESSNWFYIDHKGNPIK
jgi:hypothetical protein